MAQQSQITVFDGAATPVSHLFYPVDNKTDPKTGARISTWRENNASVPNEAQASVILTQKVHPSKVVETRIRVNVPVMESVAGQNASGYTAAPKVAYVDSFEQVSYAHPRSTPSSRKVAAQMLRNLLNNVSTTVTPVSAGVVHDAAVDGFMPT